MKTPIFTLTAIFALCTLISAYGNPSAVTPSVVNVITLQAVTDRAVFNNPGLAAAEKMARSYDAKSHRQFFLENPMVGFDVMGIGDRSLNFSGAAIKYLTISQNIPFPLKYIWKAGGAVAESDEYRYMYEMKKSGILNAARAAYYELYKTMKYIEITGSSAGVMKQISNIAFVKYNQGMVSQQDVFKADIESDTLANELIGLNRQKETDIQALREVTGDNAILTQDNFNLEDPVIPVLKKGFDEIKEQVLNAAPVIKAARAGKAVSDNMRDMAIADYIPDLNVLFKKSVMPGSQDYELMVEAEIPIFFLNNQQADIEEKGEMAGSKQDEYVAAQNSAVLEAKDHYETIMADARSMDLYKNKLIPQAEAGLKSAVSSYQSKKMEFMELLDSERMLLDMKKDYYMRLTEYLMHFRMLEELTGEATNN
jgi:outer membrane protein TolC